MGQAAYLFQASDVCIHYSTQETFGLTCIHWTVYVYMLHVYTVGLSAEGQNERWEEKEEEQEAETEIKREFQCHKIIFY